MKWFEKTSQKSEAHLFYYLVAKWQRHHSNYLILFKKFKHQFNGWCGSKFQIDATLGVDNDITISAFSRARRAAHHPEHRSGSCLRVGKWCLFLNARSFEEAREQRQNIINVQSRLLIWWWTFIFGQIYSAMRCICSSLLCVLYVLRTHVQRTNDGMKLRMIRLLYHEKTRRVFSLSQGKANFKRK